jgi:hypothetical protein
MQGRWEAGTSTAAQYPPRWRPPLFKDPEVSVVALLLLHHIPPSVFTAT